MATASGQLDLLIGSIQLDDNINLSIKSHGASGMLDPENVVFYHPLNDNTEYTLTDTWDGSGVFVPGVIGSGVSAVTAGGMLWGSSSGAFDSSSSSTRGAVDLLDTDKVIITANVFDAGAWRQQARVASLSNFNITYGSGVNVRTGNMFADVAAITPSSAVLVSQGVSDAGKARVASISGLEVTLGSEFQYDTTTANFMTSSKRDASGFIVSYQDVSNGPFFGTLIIGEVSGTSITYGSEFVYHSGSTWNSTVEMINASQFVVAFRTSSGVFSRVGSLSGTTVTSMGSATIVASSGWDATKLLNFDTKILDSTRFLVAAQYDTGGGPFTFEGRAVIGSISGTTITFNTGIIFTDSEKMTNDVLNNLRIAISLLGEDEGVITYKKGGGAPFAHSSQSVVFNTSGTTIISTTPPSQWDVFEMTYPDIVRLSNTRVCGILGNGTTSTPVLAYVGEFPDSISLTSSNPDYPEPISNKNLATFFWSKNPTKNNAEVRLERGYNITFTSGSIALGGSTATWNSSGIQSMMDTLNDDSEHSLATYFVHQSGTTWQLSTSVDGEPFVDRGTQDVGSQVLLTSGTDAQITLTDPQNENQWIDEAVLWAGEPEQFDQFTTFELSKLDGLARLLDEPMPSFQSSNLPASGNITLFTEGGVFPSESGITLFTQGIPAGASFEKIVDVFLRTADFHPTIIGVFTPPVSGVTIAIWNLIGGVNTQLTIDDAICFPIGDTGRFGWSTENLPTENIHDGQYLFRMADSTGETFVGEFFLNTPESRLS